ncbi:hypothetical protein A9255_09305 [Xenorhabdus hominickii]|uniref:Uncharacterized protein n=1 Tax=Xenorhabdus hominickii TaxID=351679 RepID=A0A2G0QAP6_XENHO|nr:hypothetical protein A9255_09305 [Xenorhabdus hominickii]PHM56278.1 hypothetical protein Xhom_01764 [Xenorhabdus hominickii]
MCVENILRNALQNSLQFFNLKSTTKSYSNLQILHKDKRQFYSSENIQKKEQSLGLTEKYVADSWSNDPHSRHSILLKTQRPNEYVGNVWVCDSWAKIVCHAYRYPVEWKITMSNWHIRGKVLSTYNEKNISPKEEHVYHLMERCHFFVLYIRNISISHLLHHTKNIIQIKAHR